MYYLVSSLRTPTTISKSKNQLKSANKFLSLLNTVEKMSCDYFQFHRQMNRLLSIKLLNGYFFFLLQLLLALNNIMYWLEWVMIICSKFVCSKNLLDTIFHLLDTIRAIIIFFVNCSNPVDLCGSTGFKQFHFQTKKYQLLELQMVDKGFGKYQLLDTIYSKENGVHVQQLGQVYMYGSQDRCTCMTVRLGVGQVRLG